MINLSVCQKHSCYLSYSCSKKEFYPCAKNIRDIREIRVQRKKIVFKKSSPPKSHTPMQNPGGPLLSYSISVTFPSLMKNEQSYFSIFLPFFITTPACRLPLMAQPEMSYSLPSIAFVVRTDVMPDFMSSGISLFSNISVPFS